MPLTLATFNVKDLLAPTTELERQVLPRKVEWIAGMLRACDADVVGLEEVGPTELLLEVLARLPGSAYAPPVMGTVDARGIRCALIARVPVLAAEVHTAEALAFPVFRQGDPPPFGARIPLRRGVVHVRVEAPGLGPVEVLVAHFKSSRPVPARDAAGCELPATDAHARAEGAVRSQVWRAAEALYVRGLVDAVLARDAGAHVAVVGDLNDVPDSPVLRAVRGDGAGELLDCADTIDPAARFSTRHDGRPSQIDHVLCTAALRARLQSARFLNAELREHAPMHAPAQSTVDDVTGVKPADALPTIDSDHAPLVTRFG